MVRCPLSAVRCPLSALKLLLGIDTQLEVDLLRLTVHPHWTHLAEPAGGA
jgi:hypothetical protein